jgi:hypothetical protein
MKQSLKSSIRKIIKNNFKYLNLFYTDIPYPETKFVIYTRGRTGSTVLTDLLNCHPDIFCDVEIFNFLYSRDRVFFPGSYINSCSKKAALHKKSVYGFKVKIAQLRIEHKYKNYHRILEDLHKDGWKFIHLIRKNYLRHKISNLLSFESNIYHIRENDETNKIKIKADCDILMASIKYGEEIEKTEEENLKDIPSLKLIYERDLLDNSRHQETADRIFSYLGLKTHKVKSQYKRVSPPDLRDTIINYDEVYNYFKNTEYFDLLINEAGEYAE